MMDCFVRCDARIFSLRPIGVFYLSYWMWYVYSRTWWHRQSIVHLIYIEESSEFQEARTCLKLSRWFTFMINSCRRPVDFRDVAGGNLISIIILIIIIEQGLQERRPPILPPSVLRNTINGLVLESAPNCCAAFRTVVSWPRTTSAFSLIEY